MVICFHDAGVTLATLYVFITAGTALRSETTVSLLLRGVM
jgi:hypothetical protein